LYRNLGHFISILEKSGELERIRRTVSPCLEIGRITDVESKKRGGGRALLFETVTGSPFPVITNLFGSNRRVCIALGVEDLDELGERIRRYTELNPPRTLKEMVDFMPMAFDATKFFPRTLRTRNAPCQAVVMKNDAVDLTKIPVLQCWPKDAGPFITLPLVITKCPETGKRNMGMYRMQVYDRRTTAMHWHIHKDGSHYYGEYAKRNKRMPVAVAIGADPATIYAATAPMPRGIDELILAGFIRKKPVRTTRCVTVDLEVPAEAEFVIEGYVDPGELRREGPFGDHTGYYSLADDYPVLHVTAVTHRKNPVYATTLVGRPPMEDCYLALATERMFLPLLQTVMPEIRDYWFPWEGVFHNVVVVSIDKAYAGHAQKIMSGLWGQGQMSFCKTIIVVDGDVNPNDRKKICELLVSRLDVRSDLTLISGVLDVLDHASPHANFGGKIGIDLTRRWPGEPPRQTSASKPPPIQNGVVGQVKNALPWVADARQPFKTLSRGSENSKCVLLVAVEKKRAINGRELAKKLLSAAELDSFDIMVMFDAAIDLADNSLILWKLFNNVDPKRDLVIEKGRTVVDACIKGPADDHHREWPEELTFDPPEAL